jgi:hypothetical protein
MDEFADELEISWQHFDILKSIGAVPRSTHKVNAYYNAGGASRNDVVTVQISDSEVHVCSSSCEHIIFGDSGDYICSLSGRSFGQQVSNGSYSDRTFTDDVVSPSHRVRKRRNTLWTSSHEEIYSACSMTIKKLLSNQLRDEVDATRLDKSLKAGLRIASSMRSTDVCVMHHLFALLTEVERCGANTVKRKITEQQLESLARILTEMFHIFISPYQHKVAPKRPTNLYFAVGMCYVLATPALGEKLYVPLLAQLLPEEKSLKSLHINVSRTTIAKRYCLDAIRHYIVQRRESMAPAKS